MRKQILLSAVLAACPLVSFLFAGESPYSRSGGKATITFEVVDDGGASVPSALVHGHFWNPHARDYAGDIFKVTTDEKGRVRVRGRAFDDMQGGALCEGYYRTDFRMVYPGRPTDLKTLPAWPDWVATNTIVLKRIRNPAPMYVKRIEGPFPARDVFMGYDMMAGDWVPPYGRGREVDMELRYSLTVISTNRLGVPMESDSTRVYRYPREGDGILQSFQDRASGSAYTTLYEAPADGYVRELAYRRRYIIGRPLETNSDPNHCHYFRIRTAKDKNGNIIKAMYGKIVGSMLAQPVYYLNPDGTRNIEFDPKRNLLRLTDSVGNPLRFTP